MPSAGERERERAADSGGCPASAESLLRLPFDLYARCRLVVEAVERVRAGAGDSRSLRVLDMGGGPHSVASFLTGDDVVTVDRWPPPSSWYALPARFALADGAKLPFADGAFDVVISLDTLEHVPQAQRNQLLAELVRVTGGWTMVACPCATEGVADADAAVLSVVERRFGEAFPTVGVLREHLGYGHPHPEAVRAALEDCETEVAQVPSGRLDRWLPMTLVFYALLALGDDEPVERVQAWYNAQFTVDDRRAPAYRQAFLARRTGAFGPDPREVAAGLTPDDEGVHTAPAVADDGIAAVRAVLEHPLVELAQARQRRIEELESALAAAGAPAAPTAGSGAAPRAALRALRQAGPRMARMARATARLGVARRVRRR